MKTRENNMGWLENWEKFITGNGDTMTKTDEQYIKTSGLQCPSCEAYEVTTVDRVETDDGSAWQEVNCDSCKATWQDIYKLTGYDNLEIAK